MDQTQIIDEIVRRTGALALLYYPELPGDDPGYSLARDVDHILGAGIPDGADRDELRELLARVILDPTGTRDALHHALHGAVTLIPAP